ncbi:hypothetical protein ACFLZI_00460 [Nitrospirota bacterium]
MQDDFDNIEAFEREDTAHTLPLGWKLLFIGLILWGLCYAATYLPASSGWTQAGAYEQSLEQDKK